MSAVGYVGQRQVNPLGFGAVLALHGAAIAAVLMIKGPEWIDGRSKPTSTFNVPHPDVPPENEPPPLDQPKLETPRSRMDVPIQIVRPIDPVNSQISDPGPPLPPTTFSGTNTGPAVGTGTATVVIPPRDPPRPPVRVDALFDPRFARFLQPPYPASEIRRQREGSVRLRVTISPEGRVTAAERIDATSDDFWDATQRQALSRWRFRPATVDGRPVESSKVLSVRFRLDG